VRDPKRIEKVLSMVRNVWLENPDLRFFQVVEILKSQVGQEDCFYIEDETLLEAMES
jgi:uncharacterized protein YihD (DUF1040 family)